MTTIQQPTDWLARGRRIGARVYNAGNTAIVTGTLTALTFGSERWDTDNFHDTSTNPSRLTIPRAGSYLVGAQVDWEAAGVAGERRLCNIRLNGTTYISGEERGANNAFAATQNIASPYEFVAGDYVECIVYHNRGVNLNVAYSPNYSPEFWIKWDGY